jgi:hypothetical protein
VTLAAKTTLTTRGAVRPKVDERACSRFTGVDRLDARGLANFAPDLVAKATGETVTESGLDRSGEGRNRTGDTTVFSRVLYQLSYLARRGDSLAGS